LKSNWILEHYFAEIYFKEKGPANKRFVLNKRAVKLLNYRIILEKTK